MHPATPGHHQAGQVWLPSSVRPAARGPRGIGDLVTSRPRSTDDVNLKHSETDNHARGTDINMDLSFLFASLFISLSLFRYLSKVHSIQLVRGFESRGKMPLLRSVLNLFDHLTLLLSGSILAWSVLSLSPRSGSTFRCSTRKRPSASYKDDSCSSHLLHSYTSDR